MQTYQRVYLDLAERLATAAIIGSQNNILTEFFEHCS